MNKAVFSIFIFTSFTCQTIIDIDIPKDAPSLVINSTLSDEEFIQVNISESRYILEPKEYKMVTGATVDIYENNQYLTTLPDSADGIYISSLYKPQRGSSYRIEVSKTGFETTSAEVLMPLDTAKILEIKTNIIYENDYGYETRYLQFNIKIDDDISFDNYYNISIYQGSTYAQFDYSVDPPLFIDSVYQIQKLYLESRDPSLEEFQAYGQNIIFNDQLFNGNKYVMKLLANYYQEDISNEFDYFVSLSNTSESYYLYEFTTGMQYWNSDNPFAQPVTVYNNIENGFGIFGAYNTALYKVE